MGNATTHRTPTYAVDYNVVLSSSVKVVILNAAMHLWNIMDATISKNTFSAFILYLKAYEFTTTI